MAEKGEKTSKSEEKLKNWTRHDADGDIAPLSSEKGKMVNTRFTFSKLATCYVAISFGNVSTMQ